MRYFLDQDNSSHWYLVQEDKREEWTAWLDLPFDDPKGWDAPDFAKPIDGFWNITFTDPQERPKSDT